MTEINLAKQEEDERVAKVQHNNLDKTDQPGNAPPNVSDTATSTEAVTPSLADMSDRPAVLSWYQQYATRKVAEVVRFVHDQGSEAALAEILKSTSVCNLSSDRTGHILFHFDLTLSGESKTAPTCGRLHFARIRSHV
jgi:hypothetical protein